MKLRAPFLLLALLLFAAGTASSLSTAKVQFGTKPYRQWTAREVEKVLYDSPWAVTEVGLVSVGRRDPLVEVADTSITVRLRSALPIRQAIARLHQIKEKYDQKPDNVQTNIDARDRELLECPDCADYYIVSMTVGAGSRKELPAFLSAGRSSFENVKQNVVLENDKHESRELKKFVPPTFAAGEAIFYFNRRDGNGTPLIGPNTRTVIISFDPRVFDWKKATVTKFKFEIARMIFDGKVEF
jgi:hypothetical protein